MISRVWKLAVCLLLSTFAATTLADEPTRIRVLSYNIRHGRGMDDKLDLERTAKVILSVDPDIVSLQEVDRKVKRSQGLDEPAELGRLTKMTPLFERNIPLQGGEYGNAILSRLPVKSHRNIHLPSHYNGEQRGALIAGLTGPDKDKTPLWFIATHLDFRPDDAERLASVKAIEKALANKPDALAILAGDLNAGPNSPTLKAFGETWTRTDITPAPTFPANNPRSQIDYVLVRPAKRWKVVESKVLDEPVASDHRPLLVVLELVD